ncbi:MAG: hypothetical protein AAF799_06820 [Myxococcota bacterium]
MKAPALLLSVPLLVLVPSCDKGDGEKAESKAKDKDDAEAKGADAAEKGADDAKGPAKPPPAGGPPASCTSVLMTKQVSDATADLKMTVDGKPFAVALDAGATYDKNPVWDAGRAPASCGNIQPRSKGGFGLVYVAQLHQDGKPVFRLQMTGLAGGSTDLKGSGMTGMALVDGDKPHAVSFTAGTITTTPAELAEGKVELKLEGAKGTLVGEPSHEFTLDGTVSGTFAKLTY